MHTFYTRLNHFLIDAGLDVTATGCLEADIAQQEKIYGIRFPLAYRLFLQWCGNGRMEWMDGRDFTIHSLPYFWESANALLTEQHERLEPNAFVFTEWQGYNFHYFLLNSSNPVVKLSIIKYYELGLLVEDYGRFTDWLIDKIKSSIRLRQSLNIINIDVPAAWAVLDHIALLADKAA